MKKRLAACVVFGFVAGCTPGSSGLVAFTAGDVATAAAIANTPAAPTVPVAANAVDPSGYQCWGSLGPGIAALQAGKNVGLATAIEIARVAIINVRTNGPCGALASPILSQLALIPGASNAIAIAATSVR